jgi:hypothetical protein
VSSKTPQTNFFKANHVKNQKRDFCSNKFEEKKIKKKTEKVEGIFSVVFLSISLRELKKTIHYFKEQT